MPLVELPVLVREVFLKKKKGNKEEEGGEEKKEREQNKDVSN